MDKTGKYLPQPKQIQSVTKMRKLGSTLADEVAEKASKRLARKIKAAVPGPLGAFITGFSIGQAAEAKGYGRATQDEIQNSIPGWEWVKIGGELITGKEYYPAPGEVGFWTGEVYNPDDE